MISEQERAFELEADEYRATEVRTMEVTMWITRETDDESRDIEVSVSVDIDGYGVRPDTEGLSLKECTIYQLTKAEMDRAADQAWEEAHEE